MTCLENCKSAVKTFSFQEIDRGTSSVLIETIRDDMKAVDLHLDSKPTVSAKQFQNLKLPLQTLQTKAQEAQQTMLHYCLDSQHYVNQCADSTTSINHCGDPHELGYAKYKCYRQQLTKLYIP